MRKSRRATSNGNSRLDATAIGKRNFGCTAGSRGRRFDDRFGLLAVTTRTQRGTERTRETVHHPNTSQCHSRRDKPLQAASLIALTTSRTPRLPSAKYMRVLSAEKSGLGMPAKPGERLRFMTTTVRAL